MFRFPELAGDAMMPRWICRLLMLLPLAFILTGCSNIPTAGQVVLTPLTVVRDTVDAPLVSLTNVFETFASWSNPKQAPNPWVGWDFRNGFNFGIGYGLGWAFFKGLSGIVGGVDYLICRSLYPAWPAGISPWKKKEQSWGDLYFPNTRALWGDDPPDTHEEAQARKQARTAGNPSGTGPAPTPAAPAYPR